MSQSLTSQSYLTSNIDKLVQNILSQNVYFDDIREQLNKLYLPFMNIYDKRLVYSQPINAFICSTSSIIGDSYPCNVVWNHENTQQLINNLLCYKSDTALEYKTWHGQEFKNRITLEVYIRNLTDHFSKLLFVWVDLKYQEETNHLVTIDMFNNHMRKIRELISNKKSCFKCLEGYAWALEQGYKKDNFHCHLILIYNGSRRESDCGLAIEVGKKWIAITEGLGTYFNYNTKTHKSKYQVKDELGHDRLGIGMIHRKNAQQVENAVRTVLYLTKPSKQGQQLKVWLPKMRTFGHGTYRNKKRRGLPPIVN